MYRSLFKNLKSAIFITIFIFILSACAFGADYVGDEIIVQVKPDSSRTSVNVLAQNMGGYVLKDLGDDTYVIKLNGNIAAKMSSASTLSDMAINLMLMPAEALNVLPNAKISLHATPNDEHWNRLWYHKAINMPKAWDIQKGSENVTVAVLDTGILPYEDLDGRTVEGRSFIGADPTDLTDDVGHGTMIANIIAGQGDNGKGGVGVCWDGVKIMPLKVVSATDGTMGDLLSALEYLKTQDVQVVNMSLGFENMSEYEPLRVKLVALEEQGKILVASVGNDATDVFIPAKYDECIAVSSVDDSDDPSYFTCYGPGNEVDIAAPGESIYALDLFDEDYNFMGYRYSLSEGTSLAAPIVSGAAAILLSNGVAADMVRDRLISSARLPRHGLDPIKHGAGVLDVFAALNSGTIRIEKPSNDATSYPNPNFVISFDNIDLTSIKLYADFADADDDGIPDDLISIVPVITGDQLGDYTDENAKRISFAWKDVTGEKLALGYHRFYISATSTDGVALYDTVSFDVDIVSLPGSENGTYHMVAFPYNLMGPADKTTLTPDDILFSSATDTTANFALARWIPNLQLYATYPNDDLAWSFPVFEGVKTGGGYLYGDKTRDYKYPAGVGFWVKAYEDIAISSDRAAMPSDTGFVTYLYKGWNMIGTPFATAASWKSMMFTYKGKIKTFNEAVKANWVGQAIYGYNSNQTEASYYRLTDANRLEPYRGYWLKALIGGESDTDMLTVTILP